MRLLYIFITMCLPLVAYPSLNEDDDDDDELQVEIDGIYYKLSGTEATVVSNPDAYSGSITIPESVNYNNETYSVTSIGEWAFCKCYSLTSVTIPNNVTSIGEGAFDRCSSLTSVTIPNNVTSIGKWAFSGCSGLESIIVDNGNTVYDSRDNCNAIIETASNALISGCKNTVIPNSVTSIGEDAFYECGSLTSVNIPNSVTSIGEDAFEECSSLTSANIPNSVTSIGKGAFYGCRSLTSVNIPNSVTTIGSSAFKGCISLYSITIPNSVVSIGSSAFYHTAWLDRQPCGLVYAGKVAYTYKGLLPENTLSIADGTKGIAGDAFSNCIGLTSIFIPNSVTTIGENAFKRRVGLTSVTIPNGVTTIAGSAFSDCSGLTSVTIPSSVTTIGEWAFSDCNSLTSVTIPNSVTSIDDGAFYCKNLRKVVSLIETPFAIKRNSSEFSGYPIFHSDTFNNATLYVPAGTIDKYKNTEGWQDFLSIEEIDAM